MHDQPEHVRQSRSPAAQAEPVLLTRPRGTGPDDPATGLLRRHGTAVWREDTFYRDDRFYYARAAMPGSLLDQASHGQSQSADRTVLVLHGYGDHCRVYDPLAQHLAERGFRVEMFDFRGHGRSCGRRGAVDRWADYLTDLVAFMEHRRLAAPASAGGSGAPSGEKDTNRGASGDPGGAVRPWVIAHSHGGLVALAAVLAGVLSPRGLVLCSPFLRLKKTVGMVTLLAGNIALRVMPSLPFKSGVESGGMSRDPAMVEAARNDPHIHRVATPRWFFETKVVQADVLARAGGVTHPVLLMHGEEDRLADPDASRLLADRLGSQDKTLEIVPGGRHELLREIDLVERFERIVSWINARIERR